MASAALRVLAVPELLSNIILKLSGMDLGNIRRVNHYWKDVVDNIPEKAFHLHFKWTGYYKSQEEQHLIESFRKHDKTKRQALKDVCQSKGLPTKGSKRELINRLNDHEEGLVVGQPGPFVAGQGYSLQNQEYITDRHQLTETGQYVVNIWNLQAPYDKSITDEQWEQYASYRSELDAKMRHYKNTAWTDEWEAAELCRYSLGDLVRSTPELPFQNSSTTYAGRGRCESEHEEAFCNSLYLLSRTYTEDSTQDPSLVVVETRVYSPYGTGKFIDFIYKYQEQRFGKNPTRLSFMYCALGHVGDACKAILVKACSHWAWEIFSMTYSNTKRKERRSLPSLQKLRVIENHLFNTSNVVAPYELWTLLFGVAGADQLGQDKSWLFREGCRRYPRLVSGIEVESGYLSNNTDATHVERMRKSAAGIFISDSEDSDYEPLQEEWAHIDGNAWEFW